MVGMGSAYYTGFATHPSLQGFSDPGLVAIAVGSNTQALIAGLNFTPTDCTSGLGSAYHTYIVTYPLLQAPLTVHQAIECSNPRHCQLPRHCPFKSLSLPTAVTVQIPFTANCSDCSNPLHCTLHSRDTKPLMSSCDPGLVSIAVGRNTHALIHSARRSSLRSAQMAMTST
jgi:hypothetical protein